MKEAPIFSSINENHEAAEKHIKKQVFRLSDGESRVLATVDVYPDPGYYSAHWAPNTGIVRMFNLVEKTLLFYEARNPKKVLSNKENKGVIIKREETDGTLNREEFGYASGYPEPYTRPLDWKKIYDPTDKRPIKFVRINTPTADFIFHIDNRKKCATFGILASLTDPEGLAKLLYTTAPVGKRGADLLFSQALNYFERTAKAIR